MQKHARLVSLEHLYTAESLQEIIVSLVLLLAGLDSTVDVLLGEALLPAPLLEHGLALDVARRVMIEPVECAMQVLLLLDPYIFDLGQRLLVSLMLSENLGQLDKCVLLVVALLSLRRLDRQRLRVIRV